MKDDTIAAMLRAHVRAKLDRIIDEELTRAGFARDAAPLIPTPAPTNNTLPFTTPRVAEHSRRYREIRFPGSTLLSVNASFSGYIGAPGSKLFQLWDVIKQHLGDREMSRAVLSDELVTLGWPRGSLSPQVTMLIERGALLHRTQTHKVGDAWKA